MLYGTFIECILKEDANHYYDSRLVCHNYWQTKPMNESQIQDFFVSVSESCFAVMVSAKSGTKLELLVPHMIPDRNASHIIKRSPQKSAL